MIFYLKDNIEIDTDKDLSPPERHVIQKLLGWKTMVRSVEEFRQKKKQALTAGWNNSGPLKESKNLRLITTQLELEVSKRLRT